MNVTLPAWPLLTAITVPPGILVDLEPPELKVWCLIKAACNDEDSVILTNEEMRRIFWGSETHIRSVTRRLERAGYLKTETTRPGGPNRYFPLDKPSARPIAS